MTQLTVHPVTTRRDRGLFLSLPWRIYAQDPLWIPPLRQDQKELVGFAKHPFYDHAESRAFLARRGDEIVGRILGIVNHAHNERYHEKRGFFGFFECQNDQEAATSLIDAVRAWLAEREIHHIRGPVNPSLNYTCGLLIEGFHTPPMFMMTYNPPYYAQLLEGAGLRKCQDLYAFLGHTSMLSDLPPKLLKIAQMAAERFAVTLRPMRPRQFLADVRLFLDIYNAALVNTWGFVPLSEKEIIHLAAQLRHLLVPELAIVAEVEGKPIGVVFGMLDFNPRIKAIDGRLFPTGFLRLLWNKQAIKNVRLIATTVIPEYQSWGIGLVLLHGLVPHMLDVGIQNVEFSWVLESNHLSRASLEKGGAIRDKTYRIYDEAP